MDLIIDTTATDLTAAAVTSVTDDTPVSALKQLVIGDSEPFTVKFTDGSAAPAWASDATYILTVSLGFPTPAGIDELATTSTFTLAGSTRTGSLSLTSDTLVNYVRTLIGNNPGRAYAIGMSLQIRIATPAGLNITYAQLPVIVLSRVISPDVGGIATGIVALSALGRVIIAAETQAEVTTAINALAGPDANGKVTITATGTDQDVELVPSGVGRIKYTYGDQLELYIGKYDWTDASTFINPAIDCLGAGSDTVADAHAMFRFRRARGTLTSKQAVGSGDYLGSFSGMGYDGTAFGAHSDVAIILGANGGFTGSSHPTYIQLLNTPAGSTSKQQVAVFGAKNMVMSTEFTDSSAVFASGNGIMISNSGISTLQLDSYSSSSGANAILYGRRAGGSEASPSATPSGQALLAIHTRGYGTNAWGSTNVASIIISAAETFTNTAQGTQMTFGTTPIGSTTRATALTLTSAQKAEFAASVKTGAPTTGTAAEWKFGVSVTSGTSALDTTGYVELDINGTLVKLARVTNS